MIIKRIHEGCMLPPFYGVAWIDYMTNQAVCLPIPFNLLAALSRSVWIFLKHGWRPVRINPRDAYQQGRKDAERHRPTAQGAGDR